MYNLPNVQVQKSIEPNLPLNDGQSIVNQESDSSRVSNTVQYDEQSPTKCLFDRSYTQNAQSSLAVDSKIQENSFPEKRLEIVINNLEQLNRLQKSKYDKTIKGLNLEKVPVNSKTSSSINEFISTINKNSNIISLRIGDIQAKIIYELPNLLGSLISLSINNVHFCATIQSQSLLNNLVTLIIKNVNASSKLDLLAKCNSLATLCIGRIFPAEYVSAVILDTITSVFFSSREKLVEENSYWRDSIFKLPDSLSKLTTLTIGYIDSNVTFELPDGLLNLQTLTIGGMRNSTFILRTSLPSLITLNIKKIWNSTLNLSKSLDNLKTFILEEFYSLISISKLTEITKTDKDRRSVLILPNSLPSLTALNIGKIWNFTRSTEDPIFSEDFIKRFPGGFKKNKTVMILPETLPRLTRLDIGYIGPYSVLVLPEKLPKLTTLNIKVLDYHSTLILAELLPILTTLVIETINSGATLTLPNSFTLIALWRMVHNGIKIPNHCLTTLKLGDISPKVIFKRSDVLNGCGWTKPLESYHYNMKKLIQTDMQPHLCYIAQSGYAHKSLSEKLITPFGYQPVDPETMGVDLSDFSDKIEILDGLVEDRTTDQSIKTEKCFVDRNIGLKILVAANEELKEIVLAFGDLGSLVIELKEKSNAVWQRQFKGVVSNLVGMDPALYQQADALAMRIIKSILQNSKYKDYSIILTGQSLGGSLAQFVGLRNEITTMCYNAVPLGRGLQHLIGDEKLKKADAYITHVSVESDYVSDTKGIGVVDGALSYFGIRTPGNFGERESIPTAYSELQKTHSFVLGSAMKYLELDEKTLPQDLEKTNPELLKHIAENKL